jgi:serine protease Do
VLEIFMKFGSIQSIFARSIFSLCALVIGAAMTAPASNVQAQALRGLPDFADLVERTGPAVVNIRTTSRARTNAAGANPGAGPRMPEGMDENDPFYEFFRRFFPPRAPGTPNAPNSPNTPNPWRRGS